MVEIIMFNPCQIHAYPESQHASPTRSTTKKEEQISFRAAKMEWDDQHTQLLAQGNVMIRQGDLVVRCQTVKLEFNREKSSHSKEESVTQKKKSHVAMPWSELSLLRLIASGNVKITYPSLIMSAAQATYDHISKTISATGNLKGRWRDVTLSGSQMIIELNARRAEIDQVDVRINVPKKWSADWVDLWKR